MHRAAYLDFQGDIGGNRGRVRQVLSGEVLDLDAADRLLRLAVRWGGPDGSAWTILGRAVEGGGSAGPEVWEFEVVEDPGSRGG